MAKQKVTIRETLVRVVNVEAANTAEAEKKVRRAYRDGGILLDADDFNNVEIVAGTP